MLALPFALPLTAAELLDLLLLLPAGFLATP